MEKNREFTRYGLNENNDLNTKIVVFFICPFLSFLLACKNPLTKFNQWIIVLYFGLVGYSRKLSESGDAWTWTDVMVSFSDYDYKAVLNYYDSIYNIAYMICLYLLSYIKYTAIIWSLIFMLTIKLFIYIYELQFKKSNLKINKAFTNRNYIFFIFYIFFIPMTSYGVKFWVALDIFLLGYYIYVYKESIIGIVILTSSFLFHYSFAYLIILFFIWYLFSRKSKYLWLLIFILPILFNLPISFKDDFIESKYESYSSGSLIENRAFWIQIDKFLSALFSIVSVITIMFYRKHLNKIEKDILYFLVVFAVGLIPLIPTLDGLDRFSKVFTFMVLIFFAKLIKENKMKLNILFYLSLPVLSYHLFVNYFMRKGEWDIDIFYNTIVHFLTGNLMTPVI